MLDALRRGATSWVLKPLLLLLVLSFIVWGVADVFTGFRRGAVATACGATISADDYQRTYTLVMETIARRFGQRPSSEEARARGLDRAVLNDLVNQTCLDQHVAALGLAVSQDTLVQSIEKDPSFAGLDGKFDRERLNGFLRDARFSEGGYLIQRRKEELRQQLTQALLKDMPVPAALVERIHAWRAETRTIQHFTIDPAGLPDVGKADEAKLTATYEAAKRQFITPEHRHLVVLALTNEALRQRIEIPEADLRKAYDGDKDARTVQERRRVRQLSFKDIASAETAAREIASGKSFLDVAKAQGATEADIDLGLVTRRELIDPAIAEAAFKLEKDKVSTPVAGRFGTVLLLVAEIEPGRSRTFEEMKDEIAKQLAATRLNAELRKLQDAVDDGRAAGKSLKEVAAGLKLQIKEIPAVNRLGQAPDGTKAIDDPNAAVLLRAGFAGRVGVEGEAVDLADGGIGWVDVLGVTPEKQRPLADVKDGVEKLWLQQERARQLSDLARSLVERADKGEKLTDLAKQAGGKLVTSKPFTRHDTEAGVPASVVARSFGLALGQRAAALDDASGNRVLFRLVRIDKPAAPSAEEAKAIAGQLRGSQQQEALQTYVNALRTDLGVSINEAEFKRVTGADLPR